MEFHRVILLVVVGKSKKARKKKKKDRSTLMKDEELEENTRDADEDDVYMISSGDEHCSKGMKSKKH